VLPILKAEEVSAFIDTAVGELILAIGAGNFVYAARAKLLTAVQGGRGQREQELREQGWLRDKPKASPDEDVKKNLLPKMPQELALSYGTNWESHEYKVKGTILKELTAVEIDGTRYEVGSFQDRRRYSDHGHEHYATSTEFTINVNVHGAVIAVPLRNLLAQKIQVLAVNFAGFG
jgi:hypothetical protein